MADRPPVKTAADRLQKLLREHAAAACNAEIHGWSETKDLERQIVALFEEVGHTPGNTTATHAPTPTLTRQEREDRKGSLAGRDAPPDDFEVRNSIDWARATRLLAEHPDAEPPSRIGQWALVMGLRVHDYEQANGCTCARPSADIVEPCPFHDRMGDVS